MKLPKILLVLPMLMLTFSSFAFSAMSASQIQAQLELVGVSVDGSAPLTFEDVLNNALISGNDLADIFSAAESMTLPGNMTVAEVKAQITVAAVKIATSPPPTRSMPKVLVQLIDKTPTDEELAAQQVALAGALGVPSSSVVFKTIDQPSVSTPSVPFTLSLADVFSAANTAGVSATVFLMSAPSTADKKEMTQIMVDAGIDDQTIAVAMIATGTPPDEVVANLDAVKPEGAETVVDVLAAETQAALEQTTAEQLVGDSVESTESVVEVTVAEIPVTEIPVVDDTIVDDTTTPECDTSVSPYNVTGCPQ